MALYEVTAIVGQATVKEVMSIDSRNLPTDEVVASLVMEVVLDRWKASFGVDFSKITDSISSLLLVEEEKNDEN